MISFTKNQAIVIESVDRLHCERDFLPLDNLVQVFRALVRVDLPCRMDGLFVASNRPTVFSYRDSRSVANVERLPVVGHRNIVPRAH